MISPRLGYIIYFYIIFRINCYAAFLSGFGNRWQVTWFSFVINQIRGACPT